MHPEGRIVSHLITAFRSNRFFVGCSTYQIRPLHHLSSPTNYDLGLSPTIQKRLMRDYLANHERTSGENVLRNFWRTTVDVDYHACGR
jgi:hypothetical protein